MRHSFDWAGCQTATLISALSPFTKLIPHRTGIHSATLPRLQKNPKKSFDPDEIS